MRLVSRLVPYTGALGAQVVELRPGFAVVRLRERRRIQNHLHSVHAVALTNLGEFTTGLAILTGVGPGVRGIVRKLETEYHKKARGILVAECAVAVPDVTSELEFQATAAINDADGDVVATVTATWNLRRG